MMMRFPRPGCWYRFTTADWQFIRDSLALSDREKEQMSVLFDDPGAVRAILDHPKLFEAIVSATSSALLSPELFFFVVVRNTLKWAGIEAIEVADYIAVVCADFGCRGTAEPGHDSRRIASLYSIDYLSAIEKAPRHERFFLHVQCANQFLVLTSFYPDFIRKRSERHGAPGVEFYEQVVVSHLASAEKHVLADEFDLREVFAALSDCFPPARRALNHTAREYLFLGQ